MRNNTIFKQKVEKNSCFKPLTATIMLFLILCLTQFSMVSAFEFDNVITYSNWIMLNLPMWITIIGITGAIIMFSRMGKREEINYGY